MNLLVIIFPTCDFFSYKVTIVQGATPGSLAKPKSPLSAQYTIESIHYKFPEVMDE